jgi:hypothetical protein
MGYGTWKVKSLYWTISLNLVASRLGKCKLDLAGVQEDRWEKGGTEQAQDYTYLYGER